ncbi:MAG: hypothetical protein EOO00_01935, partial [Chitinophagaceae bacterium]
AGLYDIIQKTLISLKCGVIAVNGASDHIHIGTHLSPYISMDELMDEVRGAASGFIESSGLFRAFTGWDKDYIAETTCWHDVNKLKEEIDNQRLYHKTHTLEEELRSKGFPV